MNRIIGKAEMYYHVSQIHETVKPSVKAIKPGSVPDAYEAFCKADRLPTLIYLHEEMTDIHEEQQIRTIKEESR